MELRNPSLPPPPPGAVNALVNGFNAIANNVGVILFPIALDVFLWLGPRLKADALLSPALDLAKEMPANEQAKAFMSMFSEFSSGFNLFSVLRTFPMGVFSLMNVNLALKSPLGNRLELDPVTLPASFLLILLLTFAGWVGGSLYYRSVAHVVVKEKSPGILRAVFQGVLLSGLWLIFSMIMYLPVVILLVILALFNDIVKMLILLFLSVPASWLLIAVFYSGHGVFVNTQNAFVSLWRSFRLVRYSLPTVGWFSILVIVISQGMDMLWRIPPATSWMALVGIFGHAFVSTSLLAASFFYYRDMNIWIESALQWMKTKNTSSARA